MRVLESFLLTLLLMEQVKCLKGKERYISASSLLKYICMHFKLTSNDMVVSVVSTAGISLEEEPLSHLVKHYECVNLLTRLLVSHAQLT